MPQIIKIGQRFHEIIKQKAQLSLGLQPIQFML